MFAQAVSGQGELKRPYNQVERVSRGIESIINDLGLGQDLKFSKIKRRWPELFPPPLSLHTEPTFIKNNRLFINVDSSIWLQELHFYERDMLSKLKEYKIKSIKLRIGNVTPSTNVEKKSKPPGSILNNEDIAFVNEVTDGLQGTALKEAARKAIEKSLSTRPSS